MNMKKPNVTLKLSLDERLLLGSSIFLLLLSMAVLVIAAKAEKPTLVFLGFLCLGVCYYMFTLLCIWRKPLDGSRKVALEMSGFFLALSMLAVYGISGAIFMDELITMAVLGAICFVIFLVFFTFFCVWQKADSEWYNWLGYMT